MAWYFFEFVQHHTSLELFYVQINLIKYMTNQMAGCLESYLSQICPLKKYQNAVIKKMTRNFYVTVTTTQKN